MGKVHTSIHPIVAQIVNRDCHVGWTTREVVQHVISKLKQGLETYQAMRPGERSYLVRSASMQHHANRKLFHEVMSGLRTSLGTPKPIRPLRLRGHEVCALMRKHQVTIRELSLRMAIPMVRIRQIRRSGIEDAYVARDWIQAITGEDPGPTPRGVRALFDTSCDLCGLPLAEGNLLWDFVGERFCSLTCCNASRIGPQSN